MGKKNKISRTPDMRYQCWSCNSCPMTVTETPNKIDAVENGTKLQELSLKLCFTLYRKKKKKHKRHLLVPGGPGPLPESQVAKWEVMSNRCGVSSYLANRKIEKPQITGKDHCLHCVSQWPNQINFFLTMKPSQWIKIQWED